MAVEFAAVAFAGMIDMAVDRKTVSDMDFAADMKVAMNMPFAVDMLFVKNMSTAAVVED